MEDDMTARWRARSLAAGWSLADDWWTPEADCLLKAMREARPRLGEREQGGGEHDLTADACRALGAARAGAGVGIAEAMTDLAALWTAARLGEPPFAVLRAFAAGWAERSFAPMGELGCEDPLTGLASAAYLRTRLAQLYRGSAAGTCLVVAEPDRRAPELAERLAAALNLATALRRAFPGDETLALLAPSRVAALTRADDLLAGKLARLRAAEILYGTRPQVRVRPLPKAYGQALALVRTLSLDA
ncbi:hypothetical protein MF672_011985 [Actinomadura sp. ATCC 31491]|uniref:GGDEF domain-containing protein n=1 Tax=Actinomadura luzonensis TaxID=2805427 RepID=A0ABT0FQA4_9ACTN|nr:hypothetical protein [Actinomadura luzonensis]MCK2214504.1 hypothetical protein [Actinomadura luzonensis]